ncbi:MAG: c-type cytochrome [Gemmatales bacterium]|nr:c-type cytochrome [Gemmatales bacterium]MDW8386628.1 c-type cytochrome [Gemmatales bacterium]
MTRLIPSNPIWNLNTMTNMIRFLQCVAFVMVLLLAGPLPRSAAQREFGFDNTKPSGQPYLSPEESLKRMKVAPGFEIKLFAAEPDVINPIAFTLDEKGRVWVVECYEYPLRTPPGKAPRDRIIILEDTDGDGRADKRTVFAEGKDFPVPKERAEKGLGAFDLASGIEVGHGGVFVGAPPYLWYIENKNDKPGRFEILLKGFGSQDTHETLNTFQWGPDGRLYGLHGVFTQSDVVSEKGDGPPVRMNAAVWRYDVHTRNFEVFAEGTSNPWGMDFDSQGNCFLCCCVIPHLFHIVPGGIYIRQAGSSYNPYVFSYMKEICDHTHHKESGWAHAGLLCLDNDLMPEDYRTSVIMGSIHGCSIKRDVLRRNSSSFVASHAEDFLVSGDKNFRPINLRWGPNGDIYVIDWHDQNPCHQARPDSWDKERGRVYRIQRTGAKPAKAEDLSRRDEAGLRELLSASNPYLSRTAARLLRERLTERVGEVSPRETGQLPLPAGLERSLSARQDGSLPASRNESLAARWTTWDAICRCVPAEQAVERLLEGYGNDTEVGRMWRVRFVSETRGADETAIRRLAEIAAREQSPQVKRELASAAIRLGQRSDTRPLVRQLLNHADDANDPMIPQMLWLAYENQVAANPQSELDWMTKHASGNALLTEHIVPKVMRRLVAMNRPEVLALCVNFAGATSDTVVRRRALEGLAEGLRGRVVEPPPQWDKIAAALSAMDDAQVRRLVDQLSVNFRSATAARRAYETVRDAHRPAAERAEAVRNLVLLKHPEALAVCLSLVRSEKDAKVRLEACRALASFEHPDVARQVLRNWAEYPPEIRRELLNTLKTRKEWARHLLDALERKQIAREEIHASVILSLLDFNDASLNRRIEQVWGQVRTSPPPAELEELIARMRKFVTEKPGDAQRGQKVFEKNCQQCHKFDGRGHEVGPNLDGAERSLDYILVNVLDPNRVIGLPYYRKTVLTTSGKLVTGLLHSEEPDRIVLKVENGVLESIPRSEIDMEKTEPKSLMPEGLDKNMTPEDFRDLVQYLLRKP